MCGGISYFPGKNFRNFLDSEAVMGRRSLCAIISSDSLTVKVPPAGRTSTNFGLVLEVVRKVRLGIFCAVADGIVKSLVELNIVHPPLESQALFSSQNIPMRNAMGGVVTSDINPIAIQECKQNHRKPNHKSTDRCPVDQQRKTIESLDPVSLRHFGINPASVAPPPCYFFDSFDLFANSSLLSGRRTSSNERSSASTIIWALEIVSGFSGW